MIILIDIIFKGKFGFGTVLSIALQASFLQFACRVCRFEPRDVQHENIGDTVRRVVSGK